MNGVINNSGRSSFCSNPSAFQVEKVLEHVTDVFLFVLFWGFFVVGRVSPFTLIASTLALVFGSGLYETAFSVQQT